MFKLLYLLIHLLQPYLVPICFCITWGLITLLFLTIWSAIKESMATAKRLHQIPCANCQFSTNDYRLKCTVHPSMAHTESAINCLDYCSKYNQVTIS